MNSLSPKKTSTGKKLTSPFSISVIITVLLLAAYFAFPSHFTNTLHTVGAPLWKAQDYTLQKTENISTFFASKQELKEENERLKNKLKRAKADLIKVDRMQEKLNALQKMSEGDRQKEGQRSMSVSVLKRPNVSLYDNLILDAGKEDGVKEGQFIQSKNSITLGKIKEVYDHTSKATLFSSPGVTVNARLQPANVDVTLTGLGGGTLKTEIPQKVEVEEGDQVVIPEFDTEVFSTVSKIVRSPADPHKTILTKMPVNIFELSWVKVIQKQ